MSHPRGDPHYARLLSEHRRPYRTRNGWIAVLLYTKAHWRRFFRLVGREDEFDGEPRLSDRSARLADIDFAYGRIADALGVRSTSEWLADLVPLDIPVAPIHDIAARFGITAQEAADDEEQLEKGVDADGEIDVDEGQAQAAE